jgi:hypothetical protein
MAIFLGKRRGKQKEREAGHEGKKAICTRNFLRHTVLYILQSYPNSTNTLGFCAPIGAGGSNNLRGRRPTYTVAAVVVVGVHC